MKFNIGDVIIIKNHSQLYREFGANYDNENPCIVDDMMVYLGKRAAVIDKWVDDFVGSYLYTLDIDGQEHNWHEKWLKKRGTSIKLDDNLFEI